MSASHYLVTEKPELADFLGWLAYIDLHRESTLEKNVTGIKNLLIYAAWILEASIF